MYIGVIIACLRSVGISPVFSEALYSSWRGWARLLLHCLRSIAGNLSGHPDSFYCIYVFSCNINIRQCISLWVSEEVLWILIIVIIGSGVLKTLLCYLFSSSLIFLLLGSKFPSSSWRGPIPALIVFFYEFVEIFWVFLDSSNSSHFSYISFCIYCNF